MKNVKVVIILIVDVQKDPVEIKSIPCVYVGFPAIPFFLTRGSYIYGGRPGYPLKHHRF